MSDILLACFVLIVFPTYIMLCCQDKSKKFMSVSQTTALKGFAIIMTYFHHFGQIRYPIYNAHTFMGYLGVALFLFMSGYITNKQSELKGECWAEWFWLKKLKRLFVPRIVVVIVFGFLAGRDILENTREILWFVQDWFLTVILINYTVFYVAKKLKKNPLIMVVMSEMLLVIICILSKQQVMWYNTAFMFGLGMLCSMKEKQLEQRLSGKSNTLIMMFNVLLFVMFLYGSVMRYQRFVFDTLTGMIFVLLICVYTYKFGFYSSILEYVGKYSWEFYLVHTRIIGIILNRLTENNLLAFIISFVVSLMVAFLVNESLSLCYKMIDRYLRDKRIQI